LITYNMPFDYALNDFGNRDVSGIASRSAYWQADMAEGAYNFWTFGFGGPGDTSSKPDLNQGGHLWLRDGSQGEDDGLDQGIVSTLFQVVAPSNADVLVTLSPNANAISNAVSLIASASTANQLKIRGYSGGSDY